MTNASALAMALVLSAGQDMVYFDQPPEGFEALRFTRRVVLEDFNVRNDAIIQPGTWLVQDRAWKGAPLWCGPISTNRDGALMIWCFHFEGGIFRSALGDHRGPPVEPPPDSYVLRRITIE
jgi:hypothetical protein